MSGNNIDLSLRGTALEQIQHKKNVVLTEPEMCLALGANKELLEFIHQILKKLNAYKDTKNIFFKPESRSKTCVKKIKNDIFWTVSSEEEEEKEKEITSFCLRLVGLDFGNIMKPYSKP